MDNITELIHCICWLQPQEDMVMNVGKGVQINCVKYINKDIVDQWLHY